MKFPYPQDFSLMLNINPFFQTLIVAISMWRVFKADAQDW